MTQSDTANHAHRRHGGRHETLLTAVQALFGGSVVYRLAAHFLKDPEIEAKVAQWIPKDKLPLIAAGTVAAGAVGLVGHRRVAHNAETAEAELGRALDEMTEETKELRRENNDLRRSERPDSPRYAERPDSRVHQAQHKATLDSTPRHKHS